MPCGEAEGSTVPGGQSAALAVPHSHLGWSIRSHSPSVSSIVGAPLPSAQGPAARAAHGTPGIRPAGPPEGCLLLSPPGNPGEGLAGPWMGTGQGVQEHLQSSSNLSHCAHFPSSPASWDPSRRSSHCSYVFSSQASFCRSSGLLDGALQGLAGLRQML